MNPRVLVFFVDGGTWTLLRPGIERGLLPTMARLAREGASATLESVMPTETSFATAAFALGKHPAALGAFSAGAKTSHPVTSDRFHGKRIWERLGEAGLRSIVVDFPCTWPPRPFSGVLFTGFFTPDDARDFAFPPYIAERYPNYPRGGIEVLKWIRSGRDILIQKAYELTKERFDAFRDACRREAFSFSCFYVKATDILQHYLWDDKDELLRFWSFVDSLLLEALNDGWTHVLIASDHGFDKAPRMAFFTNRWLADEGYLQPRIITGGKIGGVVRRFFGRHRTMARLYYRTRDRFVGNQAGDKEVAVQTYHTLEGHPGSGNVSKHIDFLKSDAYAPGGALHGKGIYLNRERYPVGSQGYEELRKRITERLVALRFEDGTAFQRVMRGEESYPGSDPHEIPDIVLVPHPQLFVEDRLGSQFLGPREIKSRAQGHHLGSPDGILICAGPGIHAGDLGRVSILDLYPTILQWYGIPVPGDINGNAIPGLGGVTTTPVAQDQSVREALSSIKL